MRHLITCLASVLFFVATSPAQTPTFVVPGHEAKMDALNELYDLHKQRAFANCTLWDAWLPHSTLWSSQKAREQYRESFLRRRIDQEGYVAMQQHRGMAHSDGWPFPGWQQSTGKGWHFSIIGDGWAQQTLLLKQTESADDWTIEGAEILGIDPAVGLQLRATSDTIVITTPPFRCGTIVAPFMRLEWAAKGLSPESSPSVSWQFEGESEWDANRRASFPALSAEDGMRYANVPMYKQPGYAGLLNRYRITIDRATGSQITLKSLITAIDSRHPITNALFLRGSAEYFDWTGDQAFLRANISRMRKALRYSLDEFSVRKHHHVVVPWVGHDGRSGLVLSPEGKKTQRPGLGVGNNYWDLLPFGGHDALATIYLFDSLQRMIRLEKAIESHPQWNVPSDEVAPNLDELQTLVNAIRQDFQSRFWDDSKGRFVGWIDLQGKAYDYGFTFVNLEAIHYGLASPEQSRVISEWLDGEREIEGDTSRGEDIYHWRFAPRATTKRNIETYAWMWSGPETIPWGGQVQDGGAVLGFSYFDLMSRLKTNGPDDAWERLEAILDWFVEVQAEGGYRAYYAKPGRGTLQGGGTAGGLGLDQEFFESVLVPQVMLYGFMGLEPNADGFEVSPRLPKAWPSLEIRGVLIHDYQLGISASSDGTLTITIEKAGSSPLTITYAGQVKTLQPTDKAPVSFSAR